MHSVNAIRAALLAAGATTALLTAIAPAGAATSCRSAKYPGSGYFTSLKVTGTSCKGGRDLQVSHYRCRIKKGKKGFCGTVGSYRCKETRQSIATQFNSRTTCTAGSRKVVFTYQQNT